MNVEDSLTLSLEAISTCERLQCICNRKMLLVTTDELKLWYCSLYQVDPSPELTAMSRSLVSDQADSQSHARLKDDRLSVSLTQTRYKARGHKVNPPLHTAVCDVPTFCSTDIQLTC